MRARAALLALFSLLATASPAGAADLWELPWLEVRTPHFTIASALDTQRSLAVAVELETFRRAVERVTDIGQLEVRTPTHVYVLPRRSADLGLAGGTASYLFASMRANYAVVAPTRGVGLAESLRHDYAHFLIRSRARLSYPSWYDEGFADLLATLRVEDGVLEYGRPIEPRVAALRYFDWIGFAEVLEEREANRLKGRRAALFYSQSWLLVHYLTLGRRGQDLPAQTARFLALSEAGTPPSHAFEQAFELNPSSLERLLRRHLRQLPYYELPVEQPFVDVEARVGPISPDGMAARLGTLALIRGDHEQAARYADAALARNPDNPAALVVRGDVYEAAGRFADAEGLHRRAIALEPDDALHELDLGAHFLDRAKLEGDPEIARRHLANARRHFARSHHLDPENAETLALNGASYLTEGNPGDPELAVASLEAAHARLPSHPTIKLLLAQAYLAAGRPGQARPLIDAVLAWAHSTQAGDATALLARLERSWFAR